MVRLRCPLGSFVVLWNALGLPLAALWDPVGLPGTHGAWLKIIKIPMIIDGRGCNLTTKPMIIDERDEYPLFLLNHGCPVNFIVLAT